MYHRAWGAALSPISTGNFPASFRKQVDTVVNLTREPLVDQRRPEVLGRLAFLLHSKRRQVEVDQQLGEVLRGRPAAKVLVKLSSAVFVSSADVHVRAGSRGLRAASSAVGFSEGETREID